MTEPWDERSRYRLLGATGGVVFALCLLDLIVAGLDPAVWMLIVGLVLALGALGVRNGGLVAVGTLVPTASRRFTLGFVVLTMTAVAMVALSRVLGSERTTLQQVGEIIAVGISAGVVGTSVTVLRRLPVAQSE